MNKIIGAIIVLMSCIIMSSCGPSKPALNIYTWSDYIDASLIKEFESKYNCSVVVDTFDSNEAMYSKLKAGAKGYDLIMPTSYMAKMMYEQKMIDQLDLSKIPNAKYIDKIYLKNIAFDKNMEYSIPYMLGYTCVAYNQKKLGKIDNSWNVFAREDLKGRMTMLDDFRETIGAGLMYCGYKLNSTNVKELEQAKNVVVKWKKNLAKFDNEVYKNGITSGEFWVVQGYSGDLLQAIAESNGALELMIPKEGVSASCDDMVIPADADNKELAYAFINFIIEPKNAAKNIEYNQYFAPVPEALKYVKEADIEKIFPKVLYKTGQMIQDLGDENKKFQDAWNQIKGE